MHTYLARLFVGALVLIAGLSPSGGVGSFQPVSALSQAAAVGAPSLATTAALKMFLMLGSAPDWTTLPDWYSGFIRWGYGTDPSVTHKPQSMKGEYISVGSVPKYPYPGYPIPLSALEASDENTFLHATEPALLRMTKDPAGLGSFDLSWKADARSGITQYKVYKIWFPNNFVISLPWTEWWKQYNSWFAITTVPATSATSYSFKDPTAEADRNGWTVMCYMVKSVIGGSERVYSYPACAKLVDLSETPDVYVSSVKATKLWENRIDANYARAGYNFAVGIRGSAALTGAYDAKLVLYKQGGFASTANQNSGPLQEDERVQLYFDADGVSTNLDRNRPYILNVPAPTAVTEDPVFRVVVKRNGVETMYPQGGGYYTFSKNNRVQDRLWYGALVNPASSGWKSLLSTHTNALVAKGYNTLFFDTWWPDFPYQFYSETPSVEYNPNGAMQGEYAKALDNLADYLNANFPAMTILGNTIGQINDFPREVASIGKIDGGMFETCFLTDGVKRTGATLVSDMQKMDQVLTSGKVVLCWPKFQQLRWGRPIEISPFDPSTRIYVFGLGLLMTQSQGGKFFYGPEELPSYWDSNLGQGINYFPEYRVDIGTPMAARQSLGAYVWQRQFSKGTVVVNADPTQSYSHMPTGNAWRMKIVDEYLTLDTAEQNVTGASPGTIDYDPVSVGVPITIPAASALILLNR